MPVSRARRARAATLALAVLLPLAVGVPAASAEGTAAPPVLAFSSDRDGDTEIYLRRSGGRLEQLTRNRANDFSPVWSPDGRRIAFVSDRDGDEDIYVMRADGTGVRRLTRNSTTGDGQPISDATPAWSPDGRRIAFASNRTGGLSEIWVMRSDGSRQTRLTRTDPIVDDTTPGWSPDGRSLVFASSRAGNETVDLYVMRADGSGVHAITPTDDTFDSTAPDWSPGGRLIAFATNVNGGQQDIWVVDPDVGRPRFLGGHPRYDDVFPRWTSGARRIAFWTFPVNTSEETRSADVWVMDRNGSDRRPLVTARSDDSVPDPRPRS
jgi:Tol biopolymer transport system component